jgi:hypothetical protein
MQVFGHGEGLTGEDAFRGVSRTCSHIMHTGNQYTTCYIDLNGLIMDKPVNKLALKGRNALGEPPFCKAAECNLGSWQGTT